MGAGRQRQLWLVQAGFGALIVLLPMLDAARDRLMPDDAFYYFATARNLVLHGRPSFDGLTLASGTHPLWLGVCAALYAVAGDRLPMMIPLVALVAFLAFALLWRRLGRLLDLTGWLFDAFFGLGALNAALMCCGWFTGLEVILAMPLVAALLSDWVRARNGYPVTRWRMTGLAVILFLCRLDTVLFSLPLIFSAHGANWRRALAPAMIVASVVAGFMAAHLAYFGTALPTSSTAMAVLDRYTWLEGYQRWFDTGTYADFPYHLVQVARTTYQLLTVAFGLPLAAFNSRAPVTLGFLGFIMLISIALRGAEARRPAALPELRDAAILLGLLVVPVYAHIVRIGAFREWYFALYAPFVIVAMFRAAHALVTGFKPRAFVLVQLALVPIWLWANLIGNAWMPAERARIVQEAVRLAGSGRIGSFNSGVYGWAAPGRIVNLDGLVNQDAFFAIEHFTLGPYIRSLGLAYILDADGPEKIERRIAERTKGAVPPRVVTVHSWPDDRGFTQRLYRIEPGDPLNP